jgi:hypothetical protein
MRSALLAALLVPILGGKPAQAARLEVGARLGVLAVPVGQAVAGEPISNTTAPMVPLEIDVDLRFSPTLVVGIFGRLMLATSNSPHDPQCYQCVGHVTMLGVDALFHLAPAASPDPWVGVALGLELPGDIFKAGGSPDEPVRRRTSGPMLEVQAGLDWPIGEHIAVGPWVGVAIGVYTQRSESLEEQPQAGASDPYSAAVHFWVTGGVRVTVRV